MTAGRFDPHLGGCQDARLRHDPVDHLALDNLTRKRAGHIDRPRPDAITLMAQPFDCHLFAHARTSTDAAKSLGRFGAHKPPGLTIPVPSVQAITRKQRLMGPFLDDMTRIQHNDPVHTRQG